MFKNHPRGLIVLFFTEMWERFCFYLMLGIFLLYMTDTSMGGMGLSESTAADIYGSYTALLYLTPFIGGLLTDRFIGYRRAITIGGILMGLGFIGLAFANYTFFWLCLLLVIIGNGFFKPNISTMVGNLYEDEKYRHLKDSGYNIFYMGINIGAFFCNFIAAYLRNNFGWGYAFASAGIGMFLGVVFLWLGQKYIKHADVLKPAKPQDMPLSKIFMTVFLPLIIFGIIGYILPGNIFGSDSNDAFIFACLPVIFFFISLWYKASREDKSPILALLSIYAVAITFFAIMNQNGTSITIWAENYSDRSLPKVIAPLAQKIGITQEIDISQREAPKYDNAGKVMVDNTGKKITETGYHPYFHNLPKEEWPKEGEKVTLISTELFQSVNPFFVIIFTPPIIYLFNKLRKRGKESTTPGKIGLGLFITSLSQIFMIAAVFASSNGVIKSSSLWILGSLAVLTIGELFLSPMGLSLVSKLSPPRFTALMMGGWFLAMSIGYKLSGALPSLWDKFEYKQYYFLINQIGVLTASIIVFILLKWLKKVLKERLG